MLTPVFVINTPLVPSTTRNEVSQGAVWYIAGACTTFEQQVCLTTWCACRLGIAKAAAVITQDVIPRGGKLHPLYDKLVKAVAPRVFVVPANGQSLQVAVTGLLITSAASSAHHTGAGTCVCGICKSTSRAWLGCSSSFHRLREPAEGDWHVIPQAYTCGACRRTLHS